MKGILGKPVRTDEDFTDKILGQYLKWQAAADTGFPHLRPHWFHESLKARSLTTEIELR